MKRSLFRICITADYVLRGVHILRLHLYYSYCILSTHSIITPTCTTSINISHLTCRKGHCSCERPTNLHGFCTETLTYKGDGGGFRRFYFHPDLGNTLSFILICLNSVLTTNSGLFLGDLFAFCDFEPPWKEYLF